MSRPIDLAAMDTGNVRIHGLLRQLNVGGVHTRRTLPSTRDVAHDNSAMRAAGLSAILVVFQLPHLLQARMGASWLHDGIHGHTLSSRGVVGNDPALDSPKRL